MKHLLLLRHASAADARLGQDDALRPLSGRGRAEADTAGARIAALGLRPQRVLCSTALRAHDTAQRACAALSCDPPIEPQRRLYLAAPEVLQEAVAELPEEDDCVVVVAHNPGLYQLAHDLARRSPGRAGLARGFPPAALAVFDVEGPWEHTSRLARLVEIALPGREPPPDAG